jgi:hypothetical protein
MKRLIQRFVKWLYAEGIEIQVERAIEAQFNERFPEEFRAKTSYSLQLIPQDVLVAVLRHLPNPADIIHGDWGEGNVRHIRSFTAQIEHGFHITQTALRVRLAPHERRDEICCGRYAHFLDVEVWGEYTSLSSDPDYRFRFSLMQRRLQGEGVGGTVPYWRYNAENPAVIHRFTFETLRGISRTGFQNFKVQ